jgi:hypothetical protein
LISQSLSGSPIHKPRIVLIGIASGGAGLGSVGWGWGARGARGHENVDDHECGRDYERRLAKSEGIIGLVMSRYAHVKAVTAITH